MEMYKRDEVMACDWFSDLYTSAILPTRSQVSKWNDEHYFDSFAVRQAYVTRFSFPLITKEVIAELAVAIKSLPYMGGGVPKVLELCCGSGYLGNLLKNYGVEIICTDTHKWRDDPKRRKSFFQKPYMYIEEIDALEAIEKYKKNVNCIILSWPEYESDLAARVLEKCLKYNISMIYIGEDYGGCTADDEFFDIMGKKCNRIRIVGSYVPFAGMHDDIYLVTKKLSVRE